MAQLKRIDVLKVISEEFAELPVLASCGATARELVGTGQRDNHLYVLDSMGLPAAIGLGLALGLKDVDKCVVVEGDGGLLMNLSSLGTIGMLQPERLLLIVLDNRVYASTGGQRTAAAKVDLTKIAAASGMKASTIETMEDLQAALKRARKEPGPVFMRVVISTENHPVGRFLPDPVAISLAFQRFLASRFAS